MSILTESYVETVRRLQLLGIPADVIPGLIVYVDALNERQYLTAKSTYPHLFGMDRPHGESVDHLDMADLAEYFDVDPGASGAGKYVQVVVMRAGFRGTSTSPAGDPVPNSVHSVVVKADGRVCKSAGWKAGPAKSTGKATKGQLLSQYIVADADSLRALVDVIASNPSSVHGGYLYSR